MKATAIAPSNIAFIKYWGKRDEILRIPANGSISMNLSNLTTLTTVEFSKKYLKDEVVVDGRFDKSADSRVAEHLDRIRRISGLSLKAKVVSKNNFPASTGLSSSASGFAALTVAACAAAGLKLSEKELSILTRQASGSSCRSIPDGFAEWLPGRTSNTSYSVSIYPPNYWEIIDVVVILSKEEKDVSTAQGQRLAYTSPFFKSRRANLEEKIKMIKKFIKEKNFIKFGELIEEEALELHAIMMTSKPALVYLLPESVNLIRLIKKWRREGLPVYFSLNTGQNIHIICPSEVRISLLKHLKKVREIQKIIINKPAKGAHIADKDLF